MLSLANEAWHPYWAWEHFHYGFFENDPCGYGKSVCEQKRKAFFIQDGLFWEVATEVAKEWPVCVEHFLTGRKVNPVAFLGQVCSFYHSGVGSHFSYAYNQLERSIKKKNNRIAMDFIVQWRSDYECGNSVLYTRVEKERLQEGYTPGVPRFIKQRGVGAFVQGNLFSDIEQ